MAYNVKNTSAKMIEDIVVAFGLFDIDKLIINKEQAPDSLRIPSRGYGYINKNSQIGPFSLLNEFGTPGHRYFGIIYLGCKGCSSIVMPIAPPRIFQFSPKSFRVEATDENRMEYTIFWLNQAKPLSSYGKVNVAMK